MPLTKCNNSKEYKIKNIKVDDEMRNFLFTLGCYEGESIYVISKLAGNLIINLKDGRYGIDESLAKNIIVN